MRLSTYLSTAIAASVVLGTFASSALAVTTLRTGTRSTGAIPGGNEANGTVQYVCVAPYKKGLHPGKTVAGNCNIGWGGKEIVIKIPPALYVLSTFPVVWVSSSRGQSLPANAIPLGFEANRTALYSCRAAYNRGVHLGKVVAGNCNFGWGGREIVLPSYQVLVAR